MIELSEPTKHDIMMMQSMAIKHNFIECLEYLLTIDSTAREASALTTMAIVAGNVDCLRTLLEHGLFEPLHACDISVDTRQIECLEFARENGSPWNEFTCRRAVYKIFFELIGIIFNLNMETDDPIFYPLTTIR